MPDLTFGEQVKIVLSRKGMTIKELAEMIEERTGKKMSRQNLTQRLGRDNFQEQDMRMIASILECPFTLSILNENTLEKQDDGTNEDKSDDRTDSKKAGVEQTENKETAGGDTEDEKSGRTEEFHGDDGQEPETGREITVGEFLEIRETSGESEQENLLKELLAEMDSIEREGQERERERQERAKERENVEEQHGTEKKGRWMSHFFRRREEEKTVEEYFDEEDPEEDADQGDIDESNEIYDTDDVYDTDNDYGIYDRKEDEDIYDDYEEDESTEFTGGEVNPYTGKEYATNSVRMHPRRIGYVQVYNRKDHKWTDMTEWAFLGYQERKKVLLGKDYEPPIYLD